MAAYSDHNPQAAYSAEQIEAGISAALADGNMEAVVGLLHLLAVKAPARAQRILDIIEAAKVIATRPQDTT